MCGLTEQSWQYSLIQIQARFGALFSWASASQGCDTLFSMTNEASPSVDSALEPSANLPRWHKLIEHWDLTLVFLFLAVRFVINLEMKPLFIFFAVSYLAFMIMLWHRTAFFSTLFVLFLTADSMIGTHLATRNNNFGIAFWGTMAVNAVVLILIVRNIHRYFPR